MTTNGTSAAPLAEEPAKASQYPQSSLQLVDRYIDEPRPLRVVIIGAGLTGIIAGALLSAKVPGIQLTIFEKNADVGGTWYENVYPGVRCDIPAHVYQSSFDPNSQWTEKFAQGPEIRDYWKGVAKKHGLYERLKLSHQVQGLAWDADAAVWRITAKDLTRNKEEAHEADYVLTAIGRFNAWQLPDYPGVGDFQGVLRHASHWDPTFDPAGKRVAVIGNGASGIQLVANLQKHVAHMDHYARNKTWIATSFGGDDTSIEPIPIDPSLRAAFRDDPAAFLAYRKEAEQKYFRGFASMLKGSESNEEARRGFVELMRTRLAKRPELVDRLVPDFSPHCRRLTPGPGYFEAITADNVDYVQTKIARFTPTGIETTDGTHRAVDAIFCATGANRDMAPPFPIVAHGRDLAQLWRQKQDKEENPDDGCGFPYTYLGLATPGFPNLGFLGGPNSSGRSGTVPHGAEIQATFFATLLRKLGREGVRTIQPQRQAADDFVAYSDAFFATTVLSEGCSSWYNGGKPGGRVHGLWPGSATQLTTVLRSPRWEDWEYEYLPQAQGNRLAWLLGRGNTRQEEDPAADMTPYLQLPGQVDLRDVHESWHSVP